MDDSIAAVFYHNDRAKCVFSFRPCVSSCAFFFLFLIQGFARIVSVGAKKGEEKNKPPQKNNFLFFYLAHGQQSNSAATQKPVILIYDVQIHRRGCAQCVASLI